MPARWRPSGGGPATGRGHAGPGHRRAVRQPNAAKSDYGTSYLLQAILVAVPARTSPAGGRGFVPAVLLALCTLMLSSGLQFMRFSNLLVDFIWGATLLGAMALGAVLRRGR